MTIALNKQNIKDFKKILTKKKSQDSSKGNLKEEFGKLKRGIDGLTYQKNIRSRED